MQLDTLDFLDQLLSRCTTVKTRRVHQHTLETLFPTAHTDFVAVRNHHIIACLKKYFSYCQSSTIHHIITPFHTQYCVLCLSKEDDEHLVLGPFLETTPNDNICYSVINKLQLTLEHASDLRCYYQSIPIVDISHILEVLHSVNTYITKDISPLSTMILDLRILPKEETSYDLLSQHVNRMTMYKILENRYVEEEKIINAIASGDVASARTHWKNFIPISESIIRTQDSLRNTKNLTVIANTLFRKAAQAGGVHPVYIDELSTKWALRIEQATSIEALNAMPLQMIRAYCLLVKNQSLAQYSPIVQHALTYINLNLTSSLSVKEVAHEIGISPDYLTRLFKKELGSPVIAYINHTRIQSSLKLLNTTDLTIQEIGELIGLHDTSYFDKLFKKYINMSPKQYRDTVRQHPLC